MKSTGIVRRLDSLGRLVIPVELRHMLGIETRDGVEIYMENEAIVMAKYHECCCFCGATEGLERFREKRVCAECVEALTSQSPGLGHPDVRRIPGLATRAVRDGHDSALSLP